MTNRNSSNINIPEAREAMDKSKMEAASEVGVNLKNGYNGDLTSREAGSVGGQMVKNVCPIRTARSAKAISGSIIQNSAAWRVVLEFSARKVGPKV